jgi:hypothetical protein
MLIIFLPLTLLITLSASSPIVIAQGDGTENIQVWGSVGSNPGQFNDPAGIVWTLKVTSLWWILIMTESKNLPVMEPSLTNGELQELAQVNLTDRLVLLWTTLMDMFMLRIPATIESKNLPVMEPSLTNGELQELAQVNLIQ